MYLVLILVKWLLGIKYAEFREFPKLIHFESVAFQWNELVTENSKIPKWSNIYQFLILQWFIKTFRLHASFKSVNCRHRHISLIGTNRSAPHHLEKIEFIREDYLAIELLSSCLCRLSVPLKIHWCTGMKYNYLVLLSILLRKISVLNGR